MPGMVFQLGLLGVPLSRASKWVCFISAAALSGLFGMRLEMAQFALPGRHPSVTDVFCFAVGGLAGGSPLRQWWRRDTLAVRRGQEEGCDESRPGVL